MQSLQLKLLSAFNRPIEWIQKKSICDMLFPKFLFTVSASHTLTINVKKILEFCVNKQSKNYNYAKYYRHLSVCKIFHSSVNQNCNAIPLIKTDDCFSPIRKQFYMFLPVCVKNLKRPDMKQAGFI